jgi:hypothetical protein
MMAATLTVAPPALAAVPPTFTQPDPSVVVDEPAHCILTGAILMTWVVNVNPGFTVDDIVAPEATTTAIMEQQAGGVVVVVGVPGGSTSAPVTLTFKPSGSFDIPAQPLPTSCTAKASADVVSKCGRLAAITFHNDTDIPLTFRTNDGVAPPPGTVKQEPDFHVQPGQSLLADNIPVGDKGTLEISVDVPIDSPNLEGVFLKTFTWTEPSDCVSPSPTAAPQLPTTGAHVTGVLVVGGALVGIGVVFVVGAALVRRRRTLTD